MYPAVLVSRCMRHNGIHRLILAVFTIIISYPSASFGYLKINPSNPHYFEETTTNMPVLIAGAGSIVPTDSSVDYKHDIVQLHMNCVGYARVWHFLPWAGENAIWPWNRSAVPNAPMGGSKLDMNRWNPTYWSRMRDSLSLANKFKIYAEIHLFDRCGMSPSGPNRWMGNPWASDNNINSIETPPADGDGIPDFYRYAERPNLRHMQERYIRKMIDETISFPNVIYEVENEHWRDNSPDFGRHYAAFIKDYIASRYPKSPRLVSYNSLTDDLESFYDDRSVDIINKHFGAEAEQDHNVLNEYLESHWSKGKAMNIDEFANGVKDSNNLRRMCWIIIASGGNFHIEDARPESHPYNIVRNISCFLNKSEWDFVHSSPNRGVIISGDGYCMEQAGKEYMMYFPNGGRKKIQLGEKGTYSARWWNVRNGRLSDPISLMQTNSPISIRTPDSGDWTLYIRRVRTSAVKE